MAYIGAFRYLRSLNVAECHRISSSALWSIAGISYILYILIGIYREFLTYMPNALWVFLFGIVGMTTLKELDISRCKKVNDAGIRHIVTITTLEKLCISETGLSADGVRLLSSLRNLSVLDLGGLPVTDRALRSLRVHSFFLSLGLLFSVKLITMLSV